MKHDEARFQQGYNTAKAAYLMLYAADASQAEDTAWIEQVEARLETCERYLESCNAAKEGVQASHSYREGVLHLIQTVRSTAYGQLKPLWTALARTEEMR